MPATNNKVKKRLYAALLLIVIIFAVIVICNQGKNNKYTQFNNKVADVNNIKSQSLNLPEAVHEYGLADSDGYIDSQEIYYINKNEKFERFICIENNFDYDREYKVLTFINYKKSEFYVDDKLCMDTTVNLKKKSGIEIPIAVDSLNEGTNDVIFAIVVDPNLNWSDEERFQRQMHHTLFIRLQIIVGEPDIKNYKPVSIKAVDTGAIPDIFLHEEKGNLRILSSIDTDENNLNLYLSIGNIYNEEKEFAVIFLQDCQQINIYGEEAYFIVKLSPQEKIEIPIEIQLAEKGIHNIQAFAVEAPFQLNDTEGGISNSIRVGIKNQ